MAISDAAQRNHHAIFPDHHSTLKVNDPEFVELFDNRAFDEVMSDAPLDPRTRLMAQLAAIIACHGMLSFVVKVAVKVSDGLSPDRRFNILVAGARFVEHLSVELR